MTVIKELVYSISTDTDNNKIIKTKIKSINDDSKYIDDYVNEINRVKDEKILLQNKINSSIETIEKEKK
jgi:hypothetical protein